MSADGYADRETFFSEHNIEKAVIKTGTGVLQKGGKLNTDKIDEIAEEFSMLRKKDGVEVCYVSSGAILTAMGLEGTNKDEIKEKYPNPKDYYLELQTYASQGQYLLMGAYDKAFKKYNQEISQLVITQNDSDTYINVVLNCLKKGWIPIINENDTVSYGNISFGDNDTLSGKVAEDLNADILIILSDTILYDTDPKIYNYAAPVNEVRRITKEMIKNASSTGPWGTGGMMTKLQTAKKANEANIPVALLDGKNNPISDIERFLNGEEQIGTLFIPENY